MPNLKNLKSAVDLGLLAVLVFFVGSLIYAWSAFDVPRGFDDYNQLQKVRYILTFWPHLSWDYQWAGGMPLLRWYPSAFYYVVSVIVTLTKTSIEVATVSLLYLLYFVAAVGVYAFTLKLTQSRQAGVLASILMLVSPSVWDQFVLGGVYGRVEALMLLPVAMWLVLEVTSPGRTRKRVSMIFVALVAVLALSVVSNPFFGIPTVAIALILILILGGDWRRRVSLAFKAGILAFFLSSFYSIPFLLRPPPNFSSETMAGAVATRNFFVLSSFPAPETSYLTLSPILVSFVIVMLVLSRFVRAGAMSQMQRKTLAILTILGAVILVFMATGLFTSAFINYIGLTVAILPFILAPLGGLLYHRVLTVVPKYSEHLTVLVMVGLIGSMFLVSGLAPISNIVSPERTQDPSIQVFNQLRVDESQTMYRVGVRGSEGWIGQWWNYRSNVPQTRDYFFQGVLSPEWIAWLNSAVWEWPNNYEEVNFLLDWWAVKWILVNTQTSDPSKFLSKPEVYKPVAITSDPRIYEFEYDASSPILYATNSPTLLLISKGQYRVVLNDFAYSGSSDGRVIPIQGGEFVDDYTIDELRQFDAVMIYGYAYHERVKAWNLLREYVELGGGLIIDTGFSPDADSPSIPLPSPIEKTHWTNFGTSWQFTWEPNPVTEGIGFQNFAPAVTGGLAWGVSSSSNASVRDWAKPILWDAGQPLLVVGQLGKGRVLWSGMNLPWHLASYKNSEEAKLLAKAVAWASGSSQSNPASISYEAERENPERTTVRLSTEARGVLFKEFYYNDWKASVETATGAREALTILQAGPDFMYVHVPEGTTYPATVVFEFDKTVDYLGLAISGITFLFLLTYAAIGSKVTRLFKLLSPVTRRTKDWWVEE